MGILLAFAPFFAFVVIERLFGVSPGLLAATAVSAGLLLRDFVSRGRKVKVLEIGTMILFGGLAAYSLMQSVDWPIAVVRLRVDAGLLLIVIVSMLIRQPFTIQYAKEQVDPAFWSRPEFIRTNYLISGVWGLAFLVMVIADIVMAYVPSLSRSFGIGLTIVAIVAAVKFTSWYPARAKSAAVGTS